MGGLRQLKEKEPRRSRVPQNGGRHPPASTPILQRADELGEKTDPNATSAGFLEHRHGGCRGVLGGEWGAAEGRHDACGGKLGGRWRKQVLVGEANTVAFGSHGDWGLHFRRDGGGVGDRAEAPEREVFLEGPTIVEADTREDKKADILDCKHVEQVPVGGFE